MTKEIDVLHREKTELVVQILSRHIGLAERDILPWMTVRDDLGLDSLDAVELLMAIEQETGRRFELQDAGDIETVEDIVTWLVAA